MPIWDDAHLSKDGNDPSNKKEQEQGAVGAGQRHHPRGTYLEARRENQAVVIKIRSSKQ